ncbi:RICIN domain-containing protein [Phytohabitans rumicis]|uniref:RICIN domain-containing protein n=1 Tax=Phytohabitans rumicis TaxID=1076125 RepID=UPI0015656E1D|nr:RICIN domain-containing protein [Phytohabitans rumicis]
MARYGNKCLDANGRGTDNGTRIQLWACHGGANQQWSTPVGEPCGVGGCRGSAGSALCRARRFRCDGICVVSAAG